MTYSPFNVGVPAYSRANSKDSSNNTGSTILKATPVRITATGMALIDVSSEQEANSIAGLTRTSVNDTQTGEIVTSSLIENITTSAAIGDVLYLAKTPGSLTNTKPSEGVGGFVSGDWIVRVGVVVKNESNPLLKDLLVNVQVVGSI